jgi:hypothetical protein
MPNRRVGQDRQQCDEGRELGEIARRERAVA